MGNHRLNDATFMKNNKGEITLATLGLIVLGTVIVGFFIPKPKFLDSRSREADKSSEVSAEVEEAVRKAKKADNDKGEVVAAGLVQIGVAAGQLPDSPQATFIGREAAFMSPLLPPPSPVALLASERRRVALLEGKLELADKLYAQGTKENAQLLERAVNAEVKLGAAQEARRAVDVQLQESAAYARGQDAVIGVLVGIVVLVVVLWVFAKVNGFGPKTLGNMLADIRSGDSVVTVFDRYVPVRLQRVVRHAASDASINMKTP